jgi:geranylgeranyl diphosphate synthase, type I
MADPAIHRFNSTPLLTTLGVQASAAGIQSLRLAKRILRGRLTKAGCEKTFGQRLGQILDQSVETRLDLLPLLACQALGGQPRQAIPLLAVWRLLRHSAKLLDDVADGESASTPAEAIDLATGLLFLAPLALEELSKRGVSASQIARLRQGLHAAGLRACAGQFGELASLDEPDPDSWLEITGAKSGAPFVWAGWAGVRVAGGDDGTLACFHEFGLHLGILLQVADDFNGIWGSAGANDLGKARPNLAACYARLVTAGEARRRLETLLQNAASGDNEAQAHLKSWLVELGAQAYLLVVGRQQHRQALAALQESGHLTPPLVALLDQVWPTLTAAANEGNLDGTPA